MEKSIDTKKLTPMCTCGGCPSYKGTTETILLFCYTGKSGKIKKEKGCICPGCPVAKQMGLKRNYFCTRGNEKQQNSTKK